MQSLRRTLVVGTTTGMVFVLCLVGILLFVTVRATVLNQFDQALADKAVLVADSVEQRPRGIVFEPDDLNMDEFRSPGGTSYLQLLLSDGSTLFRSASLQGTALSMVSTDADSLTFSTVRLPEGRSGREVSLTFTPKVDDDERELTRKEASHRDRVTLALARDTAPVAAVLSRLETVLWGFGLGAIFVSAMILQVIIGKVLRPLDKVAAAINRIDPKDLSARIKEGNVPKELQPVVDRLNELLDRLDAAFDRERTFSADVAHELRTPLAGLRSTLEVTMTRARSSVEYEITLRECLAITTQMQAMVDNLLTLARIDSGEMQVNPEEIPLNDLINAVAKPSLPEFAARGLQVQWNLTSHLAVHSDPTLLTLVIRNLLDNALAYTNEGGWVRVESCEHGDAVGLRVSNSGSMVHEDQVDHLFERFWRADVARSTADLHCGLGLALVRRIGSLLGCSVEAHSSCGAEFTLRFLIPKQFPEEGIRPS